MPEKPRITTKPGIVWQRKPGGGRTLRTTQSLKDEEEWLEFQKAAGFPVQKTRNGLPILGEKRKIDPRKESAITGRIQAVKYLYLERLKRLNIKLDSLRKEKPEKIAQAVLETLLKEEQISGLYKFFRNSDIKKLNTILLKLTIEYIQRLKLQERRDD